MTKYISLIFFISILLAGCNTEGEDIDTGFTSYKVSVVYPEYPDYSSLAVTLDGENLNTALFAGREDKTGTLKVTYQDYNVLKQQVTLKPGDKIKLILLPGKVIELYSEQDYITFNGSFVLNSGCVAKLNGQELVSGLNYIRKDKASGDIEFYQENEEQETLIATMQDVSIAADMNLNIMQLDEATFAEIPKDEEAEPSSNKILKARFLYTGDDVLTMDEIRLDFYLLNEWSYEFMSDAGIVGSVTLQKGQFSKYIELDCSFRYPDENADDRDGVYCYSFHFDIIDPSTGTLIVDHTDFLHGIYSEGITTDYMSWDFKKATFVLKDGGNTLEMLKGVSTPW